MRERTTVLGAALFWILIGLLASGCVHSGPKPPAQPTPIVSPTPPPVTGGPSCGELGGPQAQCGDHWRTPAPAGLVDVGQTFDCQPCFAPTPTPPPARPPAPPEFYVFAWGAGPRGEQATQKGFLYPNYLQRPMLKMVVKGETVTIKRVAGITLGDLEGQHSSDDSIEVALSRIGPYAEQADVILLGLDWADLEWEPGVGWRVKSCGLVDKVLAAFLPYQHKIPIVLVADESGWSKEQYEAILAFVRQRLAVAQWMRVPLLGATLLEREMNEQGSQHAKGLDVVFVEAYGAGYGSGNRAEDERLIIAELDRMEAMIPREKYIVVWGANYNRNGRKLEYNTDGGWSWSAQDLAALIWPTFRWVGDHRWNADGTPRVIAIALFCLVRGGCDSNGYCGGGFWDWFDLAWPQQARGLAYVLTSQPGVKGQDVGPEAPATPTREEPEPEPPIPPDTPCGLYWAQQGCGASGSDHDCDLTLICKGGALHPVAEVDYKIEPLLCGDGAIEESSGTLTYSAGVMSRAVRVPFPPDATEHGERMVRVVGVRGAALYAGEDHARGNWSPTTRGFSHLRGQCGYLASPGNPVGSIVVSGADLQARAKSEEEIFLVSYHLEDASGKVVAKNRVGKSRTNMSVIPLEVLVPAGAQGQVGWIVVDQVLTRDTKTPQPWVGPRRAPYYSTAK